MGFPIKTIKDFEEGLKKRPQSCACIIFVNPYSDSKSSNIILNNYSLLDPLSDDVDFYMPGFSKYVGRVPKGLRQIENDYLSEVYHDYHAQQVKLKSEIIHQGPEALQVEKSDYMGYISSKGREKYKFNQAEFTDFVLEFIKRSNNKYVYMGGSQLICIKVDKNTRIDYDNIECFDLDEITLSAHGPSLDRFIFEAFQIIRTSRGFPITIRELNKLYERSTTPLSENKKLLVEQNTIQSIENHLGWRLSEPFYFISYSSKDQGIAFELKRMLERRNLNVWIAPDGIPQGRDYALAVPLALKRCDNFILILTKNSARSTWVLRELDMAINHPDKKIKVVLYNFTIEKIHDDPPLMFYLNKIQIKYQFDDNLFNPLPSVCDNLDRFIAE